MIEIVKHYHSNKTLRDSFNALAEATFGLNFENWYQNGFWGDNYTPYSVVMDGKIAANVSVNRTDMVIGCVRKRLYQLGTVMTAEGYRNRGYIRAIMEEVEKDTADADGVYLFANDRVLDFYPKFGFTRGTETVYSRAVSQSGPCRMHTVPMKDAAGWNRLRKAMEESTFPAACLMVDNPGLIFFYVSQFMQDCVYFSESDNVWAIAELDGGHLMLHNVFSAEAVSLDRVIAAFGAEVTQVTLGFSPADPCGFTAGELKEEDCTFFVKGPAFHTFEGLRIPSLSHA